MLSVNIFPSQRFSIQLPNEGGNFIFPSYLCSLLNFILQNVVHNKNLVRAMLGSMALFVRVGKIS